MARLFTRANKDHVDFGDTSTFAFIHNTGIFTVMGWLAFTDYTVADYETFFADSSSANENGFQFLYNNSGGSKKFETWLGRTGAQIIDSSSPNNWVADNLWHHIAIAGDATNIFYLKDGVESTGTSTMGTKGSGNSVTAADIGREPPSPFYYGLGGKVAEFIVLDYRATAGEVLRVMNWGPSVLSKYPKCYIPLWGVASPEPDLAGLGGASVAGATATDHPWSSVTYAYVPRQRVSRSMIRTQWAVAGVTRDSVGNILGSCTVQLFRTSDKAFVAEVTSDPTTGAYSFGGLNDATTQYFVRAYKDGSPNQFGITDRALVGS